MCSIIQTFVYYDVICNFEQCQRFLTCYFVIAVHGAVHDAIAAVFEAETVAVETAPVAERRVTVIVL